MYRLSEVLWALELVFRGIGCFFTDHNEMPGSSLIGENDFCTKCLCDWPQDKITLPLLLNRCYRWFVEREWQWRWFYRFDFWIEKRYGDSLPDWWEY